MEYRKEIDGLRSVAVIPVILFHAGIEGFSGGFIGVDIFFVISGFLITQIIMREIAQGAFSISSFYERRIRRIMPALFFVLIAITPVAWFWMLPDEFKLFGQMLVATLLFSSNFLLMRDTDYFSADAEMMPLLHTWSLGIEEQFYLFIPLLLMLIARRAVQRTAQILIVFAIASFGAMIIFQMLGGNQIWAFYLLPFRAWELLLGAICGVAAARGFRPANEALALVGLALLLASFVILRDSNDFPNALALLPVAGAALLLNYAREGTQVAKLLSLRPLVWIGLISYSAYLWHQPLFAFARIRTSGEPPPWVMLGLAVVSLALAAFSWRFIEQPFRRHGAVFYTRTKLFVATAAVTAVLSVGGVTAHVTRGLPSRLDARAVELATFTNDRAPSIGRCQLWLAPMPEAQPVEGCAPFVKDGKAQVVFIGDSHSHALSDLAGELLARNGVSSYALSYGGCPPFPDLYRIGILGNRCEDYWLGMIEAARNLDARVIVLTARMAAYYEGTVGLHAHGEGSFDSDIAVDSVDRRGNRARSDFPQEQVARKERVAASVRSGLEQLAEEFTVVLVYPFPEFETNIPRTAARCVIFDGKLCDLSIPVIEYKQRTEGIASIFDSVKRDTLLRIYPSDIFCDTLLPGRCAAQYAGRPLYTDGDHPAQSTGARMLLPELTETIGSALAVSAREPVPAWQGGG